MIDKVIKTCQQLVLITLFLPFAVQAELPKSLVPFYLGVGLGSSSYEVANNDLQSRKIDETGFYYQLYAGIPINQYIAVEAGFADISKLDETIRQEFAGTSERNVELYRRYELDYYGFRFDLKLSIPVTEYAAIYGKVGVFSWQSDYYKQLTVNYFDPQITDIDRRESGSASDTDGHYAIGIEGGKNRFTFFIEHELFETDNENIYGINAGLAYHF
ncbi:outer membrane beta-barrel protein [Thalassotalea mangrovi]|uniref:Outer membrane protein OmpA-like transmembrane domain-containing protein n=1 Tax=Thalassotalea mangrovi TaxID=2572245 RepID=A0A4U1B9T4_9GAMM|nr:outer membrane beta-barrel protein [Thalassotalea mangrovi]TKB47154.1 hypothetical protein E8M12_02525 [Thalassotalea mangrovi]